MSKQLPSVIEAYFQAKNAHDIAAIAACFAENAVVHDEGEEIHGIEAVRDWVESTTKKYQVTAEVEEVKEQGNETVVTASVAGTFPGSPVLLDFWFTLENDSIVGLSIK